MIVRFKLKEALKAAKEQEEEMLRLEQEKERKEEEAKQKRLEQVRAYCLVSLKMTASLKIETL